LPDPSSIGCIECKSWVPAALRSLRKPIAKKIKKNSIAGAIAKRPGPIRPGIRQGPFFPPRTAISTSMTLAHQYALSKRPRRSATRNWLGMSDDSEKHSTPVPMRPPSSKGAKPFCRCKPQPFPSSGAPIPNASTRSEQEKSEASAVRLSSVKPVWPLRLRDGTDGPFCFRPHPRRQEHRHLRTSPMARITAQFPPKYTQTNRSKAIPDPSTPPPGEFYSTSPRC